MIQCLFPSRRSVIGAAALIALSGSAVAGPGGKGLPVSVVYELFSSQGCSSCPPADMLFSSLRKEQGVLALSLPVTIWDHLGWKDTLAKVVYSKRQKGYSHARGDRQIYTPQAVVNGVIHCVGSDQRALEDARTRSVLQPGVLAITPILRFKNERWLVQLPDSPLGRPAPAEAPQAGASERQHLHAGNVMLFTFEREHQVEIGKGENGGRTIRYGNIVNAITLIGEYTGASTSFELPVGTRADETVGFAVLVQSGTERRPGAIVGAVESPRQ